MNKKNDVTRINAKSNIVQINTKDNNVMLRNEIMPKIRKMARDKDISLSDIVNEAISEYIYLRQVEADYSDSLSGAETSRRKTKDATANDNAYCLADNINSPALKYIVRIMQNSEPYIGEMNVILKSHDINALRSLSDFLNIWLELEAGYLQYKLGKKIKYTAEPGYYSRKIMLPLTADYSGGQAAGRAISDYIHTFDELFKFYYFHPTGNRSEVEKMYVDNAQCGRFNI